MKLLFDREELLGKLKRTKNFIPDKAVIAAYETLLCKVVDKKMFITATDGQKQITIFCDIIKTDGDGMFTIPAKQLMHVLSLLIEKEVSIAVKETKVEVKSGKSKYNMPSETGENYPLMPQIKADYEASFTGSSFNQAIETAGAYVDINNTAPAYQGICFRMDKSTINVYGTNGSQVCKIVVKPRSINSWDDILIPITAIKAINKCVSDEDIVDVIHNKERIEVKTDEVSVVALAFNCKYPNVEIFFDKKPPHKIELNTVEFLHALQRLNMFTNKEVPIIKVDIKTLSLMVTAADDSYNYDGQEEIDIIAQEEIEFGMNIKFLLNIIESFTNDTFNLCYSDFQKAIHVEPINIVKDNDRFFVVMPVIL